ncbi:MAG: esterase-like activity of phytase family protein [Microcoleaceae cyanobacterium]
MTELRVSTFNAFLNRSSEGELIENLSTPDDPQAQAVAEIIQRTNPDVILLNEFDFDENGEGIQLFQDNYLSVSQNGVDPVEYPFVYLAPSNTGIASGLDFDNNGEAVTEPGSVEYGNDAFGFGFFPGQFAMVLLSKYPIVEDEVRTFQNFLWQDMPGALLPDNPDTPEPQDFYSEEELEVFRLSSKSHWDVPIDVDGEVIHVLASHPTPPAFDGPEARNRTRNFDEIRFWADYITPGEGDYIYDDEGNMGGLAEGKRFVVMGDQNADPFDGGSIPGAIQQLLDNPLVNVSETPASEGGIEAAELQGQANDQHLSDPALDTADFSDEFVGNLRVDYVLPSQNLELLETEVFWPASDDPLFELTGNGFPVISSDHRLVYADVAIPEEVTNPLNTVTDIEFLGDVVFETGFMFADTEVGGISGLAYDTGRNVFYALSDDRSNVNDARYYTVDIDLTDNDFEDGDVEFLDVTTLLNADGEAFPAGGVDPEGIALTSTGTLFISSEGEVRPDLGEEAGIQAPFVNEFSLNGQQIRELPVPEKFLSEVEDTNGSGVIDEGDEVVAGIQRNQAFESLTITPDQRTLFTATENALFQDGPRASLETGSSSRILRYDLTTGEPAEEFLYLVDAIPVAPVPEDSFADNGLVELLALDDSNTLLALERSFAVGVGNNLRLYEVDLAGATDISDVDSLLGAEDLDNLFPVEKNLLLDFSDLGIRLDNSEAVSFGPTLEDGRQSIIVASDNNFNAGNQITQFLAFAVDIESGNTLPNGVASGDTTQDSTVLWTRSLIPGDVTFEYSTDADFGTVDGTVTATVEDPTIPVKVEIDDLESGTEYFYRVTDAAGTEAEGRFATSTEFGQAGLSFGVTGDWRGELAPYPAISNAAEQNLEFFVEHGDTIYADIASPAVLNPDGTRKQQAETLPEYRAKHNEVYSERFGLNTWADLRASTSILATIDDHEVTNDFSGGAPASSDDRFPETEGLINDTELFENGLQTFQEYNPLRDDFYGETGEELTAGERQLYRFNTYGEDAAVMLLDTRSFRDEPVAPPEDFTDPAQVAAVLVETLTADKTMLGEVQLADLKQDLIAADEAGITWKFIMVPEPMQNIFPGINTDAFEGYGRERTEILSFITENEIDNVVFVAADVHTTFVNNLTYQEVPFGEQIPTNAFGVTTGAVAFDAPTGEFLGNLFVSGDPELEAFYNSLPIAPDTDDIPDDRDDFVEQAVNSQLLEPLGFDPLGLDNNLPQAEGLIDAELIQGDYFVGHTYGWTQFDIDAETQELTVTTYGIEAYSEEELLADPEGITSREPVIVSQFVVNPQVEDLPTVSLSVEPEEVTEDGDSYSLTLSLSEPAPEGGLRVVFSETDSDNAFGDIEFPPVLTNASNLEGLDAVGDELARSAITIDAGATEATVTWTTVADGETEGDETTTIALETAEGYSIDSDNQSDVVTILDTSTADDQTFVGTDGDDQIAGGLGNDEIFGEGGNDLLRGDLDERQSGEAGGDDTISGGAGNDRIGGKAGNDVLFGDEGNDRIWGDQGDDLLSGGPGNDELHGDSGDLFGGADTFVLAAGEGTDTIVDFEIGLDLIGLEGLTFADLSLESQGSDLAIIAGDETLAIVQGVEALVADHFTVV